MKTLLLISDDASLIETFGPTALEEGMLLVLSPLQKGEVLPSASQIAAVLLDAPNTELLSELPARIQQRYQNLPLVYLAHDNAPAEKIAALELGFHLVLDRDSSKELQARQLRNFLRLSAASTRENAEKVNVRKCLGLEIDISRYSVRSGNQFLPLTKTEFTLLEVLSREPGIPVTHDTLSDALWGWDSDTYGAHLKCHISRLRGKLLEARAGANIISLRGRGYSLSETEASLFS